VKKLFTTILYVEDESEVREELTRFLQRFSSHVITAENGEEGLELFRTHAPQIVITDIKMPKMNGIDMANKIKDISPDQSIIFTSAHGDNGYFLDAINMQVDGYILKPVDLGIFGKKLNAIYQNQQSKKDKELYAKLLEDLAQMQNTMLAAYDQNKLPIFFNDKLLSYLAVSSLEEFIRSHESLSAKFEAHKGCFVPQNTKLSWIEEIQSLEEKKRIVSLRNNISYESEFFLVSVSAGTSSQNTIVTFSDVSSIFKEKNQYMHDAYTDELTKIDNRTRFNILFQNAMEKSQQTHSSLSIILIDLDNFKQINDQYGHDTGDKVLRRFTTLIREHIRSTDFFARWGGEEFVILLPDTLLEDAKIIAENLRARLEKHDFGMGGKLTSSFGVSARRNGDTETSLFKRADLALYAAKNNGRNSVASL
jgi:diguanylate cyclase (GGDEF)-like protein